jgi:hypothetical protein
MLGPARIIEYNSKLPIGQSRDVWLDRHCLLMQEKSWLLIDTVQYATTSIQVIYNACPPHIVACNTDRRVFSRGPSQGEKKTTLNLDNCRNRMHVEDHNYRTSGRSPHVCLMDKMRLHKQGLVWSFLRPTWLYSSMHNTSLYISVLTSPPPLLIVWPIVVLRYTLFAPLTVSLHISRLWHQSTAYTPSRCITNASATERHYNGVKTVKEIVRRRGMPVIKGKLRSGGFVSEHTCREARCSNTKSDWPPERNHQEWELMENIIKIKKDTARGRRYLTLHNNEKKSWLSWYCDVYEQVSVWPSTSGCLPGTVKQ